MKQKLEYLFIIIISFILFSSPAYSGDIIKGKLTLVDGAKYGAGSGFSFKFDNTKKPSVAYYDIEKKELRFARVDKDKWNIMPVSSCGYYAEGLTCSLAYDSKNVASIAFVSDEKTLKLATQSNGLWNIETVDKSAGSGAFCSLSLTATGEPIISYQSTNGLKIARKISGTWFIEKIDSPGRNTYIFTNKNGDPEVYYLSYNNPTTKPDKDEDKNNSKLTILKYAIKSGINWKTSEIPGSSGCLDFDVSFDKEGLASIAYIGEGKIKVYRQTSPGIWKEDTASDEDGSYVSILSKENGYQVVSYISPDRQILKRAVYDGAKWTVKKIATAIPGYIFKECSITEVPKTGKEIIILNDGDSLEALIEKDGGWALGRIDGKIRVGGYVSAGLTGSAPAICYYDFTRGRLFYSCRKQDGSWAPESVDTLSDSGKYVSLIIDPSGNPAAAYYDKTRGDLKYAWKSGGSWRWERVDDEPDLGLEPSLTFSSSGNPMISYRDKDITSLKYTIKQANKWQTEQICQLQGYGGQSVVFELPDKTPAIIFVDGDKLDKPDKGASPIRTNVKIAKKDNSGSWTTETIAGPYAIDIKQSGFSAAVSPNREIAISFVNRDGKLQVIKGKPGNWKPYTIDSGFVETTSIKFYPNDALGVLYITAMPGGQRKVRYAKFDGNAWVNYEVELNLKSPKYISLLPSPDNKLRFAVGDIPSYCTWFFEEQ